jgi:hypothetical protein
MKTLTVTAGANALALHLTKEFEAACKQFNIDPQAALQYFIDRICIYAYLVERGTDPESVAAGIFSHYLKSRGEIAYKPDPTKREIYIRYLRKMVALITCNKSPASKAKLHRQLIKEWYAELNKL